MPFEARKTNFTVFSLNQELYNFFKSAFNTKLESTSTQTYTDVKNRGGELIKFSFLKPASTEQELPMWRID